MSLQWYRVGTVSVVLGSPTVTGVGTAWLTVGLGVGDVFIGPDGAMYEITAVASDASMSIRLRNGSTYYAGASASNALYAILPQVNATTNAQLAAQVSTLLTKWQGREDEFAAWQAGTVTGGALNANGTGTGGPYYKMTAPTGVVSWLKSPAKLVAEVAAMDVEVDAFVAAAQAQVDGYGSLDLPGSRPSLLLDFSKGHIDPRITFTRASTATYFDKQGALKTALSGEPRIDHDPTTGQCLGLLIEEQRTNILLYSKDQSQWVLGGYVLTNDTTETTAPDGTNTADKLAEALVAGEFSSYKSETFVDATKYTFSAFVKPFGNTMYAMLQIMGFSNTSVNFNLATGVVDGIGIDITRQTIRRLNNGWFRVSATIANSGTASKTLRIRGRKTSWPGGAGSSAESYTGDGASGLYVWGAQFEAGEFPSSYIPTTTAQATRATDVVSMTGTNFSSWYRPQEGTLVVFASSKQAIYSPSDERAHLAAICAATSSDTFEVLLYEGGLVVLTQSGSGGLSTAVPLAAATITANTLYRCAATYGGNLTTAAINAALSTEVSRPFNGAAAIQLKIGVGIVSGGRILDGHIRSLRYYPKKLSSAELQALTTP